MFSVKLVERKEILTYLANELILFKQIKTQGVKVAKFYIINFCKLFVCMRFRNVIIFCIPSV